jgi:hypothetical protein
MVLCKLFLMEGFGEGDPCPGQIKGNRKMANKSPYFRGNRKLVKSFVGDQGLFSREPPIPRFPGFFIPSFLHSIEKNNRTYYNN